MKNYLIIIASIIFAAAVVAWSLSIAPPALRPPTATATPHPTFTPNPEVLAFAEAMLAQRPWLEAKSTDANVPPGTSPATTFIVSRVEPIVVKDGAAWKITFKTP